MPAEQILERLMREYGDSVFRMCYLYLKDYYLAEDATQETIADDHSIEEVVKKDSSNNLSYFNAWGNNSSS